MSTPVDRPATGPVEPAARADPAGLVAGLGLDLPERATRTAAGGPRSRGLTMVIDTGLPIGRFTDVVASTPHLLDVVKFGWCTALVAPDLVRAKVEALAGTGVGFYFGGTLLERVLAQDRPLADSLDRFTRFCEGFGARTVEVSDGTVELDPAVKARAIEVLAQRFEVYAEVGYKDPERAEHLRPDQWVAGLRADLDAGASRVITESRESGSSGIAHPDGTLRADVVDAVASAGLDLDRVLFEAPTKALQVEHVTLFGPDVNLGNIAASDLVGLETLRLGLRSDTMLGLLPPGARASVPAEDGRAGRGTDR